MKRKILIVDDEAPLREMLRDAFENEGYEVVTASGGKEALQVLRENTVRVIISDLKMPGMDGLELCRRIKGQYPLTSIYALTAYMTLFGISDCLEVGFDDYFIKPVELPVLFEAVEYAFRKLDRWTERE